MQQQSRRLAVALLAWTAFVWGNRVVNAVRNDEGLGGLVLAGVVALATIVFVSALVETWGGGVIDRSADVRLRMLPLVTVLIWALRGADIALSDHEVGFIVVHLVLAATSIGLSVAMWRALPTATWSRAEVAG